LTEPAGDAPTPSPGRETIADRASAHAGLPGAPAHAEGVLRGAGIDPDRLSIQRLGRGPVRAVAPAWAARLAGGCLLWAGLLALGDRLPAPVAAGANLVAGLLVLQAACDAFVTATERLAARRRWDHYVAGTVAEILATLPEFTVIAFLVTVSPLTAFVTALITIYVNAMVFSIYSYFLPKDRRGRFLMPEPITSAGTQLLIAGAAIGLIVGLVMLAFAATGHPKQVFAPPDLLGLGTILLAIFAVYLTKLLHGYASEEDAVRTALELSDADVARRRAQVYREVHRSPAWLLSGLFAIGVGGALLGGHLVSAFAETALSGLGLNGTLTALVLAASAGMSEYVILWHAHRRQEYGIALANAFGGITQVMFLVLPFTLLAIAGYELLTGAAHPELPLAFTMPNVLLLLFLFPTFFVLAELLEENHTLGILDTTILVAIFGLLLLLLVTYGAHPPNGSPAAGG
jgi:hypothetical protein